MPTLPLNPIAAGTMPTRIVGAPTSRDRQGAVRLPSFTDPLLADAQRTFAESLSIAERRPDGTRASARETAEKLVAITFVEPVLKRQRESDGAAPPFAPGPGEKQFRALLDSRVAHDIVRAARLPIVDRLAHDLLRRSVGAGGDPARRGVDGHA
ncbi:MAG: hypothetical protein AMXMBFR77_00840 [Phycisphaerales bacterium]|nr:hypothetical protein [Phycisphaerales bacterium]GIK18508.1 MAG: hypothetical protein BroJett004_06720 [Planctomycetota bacterium]